MNEFDLLRKKTGMTIAKAWMLMLSGVIAFILIVGIFGAVSGFKKSGMADVEIFVFCTLLLMLVLCGLWGFFVNKKELPFFKKQSALIAFLCLIVILAWFYISPILYDLFPYESKKDNKTTDITFVLELLLSLSLTALQIGVIGHGLLKNYQFGKVLLSVAALSVVFVVPQAVVGMAIQAIIMFYVYYRTAAFQLPILMTVVLSLAELLFKQGLKIDISNNNYIRPLMAQTPTLYYVGIVICLVIITGGLFYINKLTKPIAWQRPDEDESMAFL